MISYCPSCGSCLVDLKCPNCIVKPIREEDAPEITNFDHGQEIIPSHILSKTECKQIWSSEGCRFGKNWNEFKEKLIEEK